MCAGRAVGRRLCRGAASPGRTSRSPRTLGWPERGAGPRSCGTDYDFRTPRTIGTTFLDHAYTGLAADADGVVRARVRTADGSGVELHGTPAALVQVHTADRPEPELDRSGLAVEPMTCPPDAFNSGTDLVVLAPGQRHEVGWTIAAI